MKEFWHNLAAAGVLVGLLCAAAPADAAPKTVSVDVMLTILPYAKVTLSETTRTITIAASATTVTVEVGGTVICNYPVSVSAAIMPPAGAPADWTWNASTTVKTLAAGTHVYTSSAGSQLLTVSARSGAAAGEYDLIFTGQGLPQGSTPATPAAGEVIVTVIPQQ